LRQKINPRLRKEWDLLLDRLKIYELLKDMGCHNGIEGSIIEMENKVNTYSFGF
jgi:hypothetical protein